MATAAEINRIIMTPKEAAAIAAQNVIKSMQISAQVQKAEENVMKVDDIKAIMDELKQLRMENSELKKRQRPITFSVTDRGAVSMSGLGKYPVTLYKVQWERIISNIAPLQEFIQEHEDELN